MKFLMRHKLKRYSRMLSDQLKAFRMYFRTGIKSKNLTLPQPKERKKNLLILAHHAYDNRIHPYVFRLIESAGNSDCDVIFVSTAEKISDLDISKMRPLVVGIILRSNIGYDFGSWKSAVDQYPAMNMDYSTIIFANDSVYGPFYPLLPLLQSAESRNLDVWAITASNERTYHLQTYFWAVSNNALGEFFDFFWKKYYRYFSQRQTVIERYELYIERLAREKFQLRTGALCEPADALEISRTLDRDYSRKLQLEEKGRLNPMHHLWREALLSGKCPFIKRELLEKDPFKLLDHRECEDVLEKLNTTIWQEICDHLSLRQ